MPNERFVSNNYFFIMWTKAVESNFKVLYRHLREPKKLTKTLS